MKTLYIAIWIAGIILANGFWSTFFAVIFPIWAYVVVVLRILGLN